MILRTTGGKKAGKKNRKGSGKDLVENVKL